MGGGLYLTVGDCAARFGFLNDSVLTRIPLPSAVSEPLVGNPSALRMRTCATRPGLQWPTLKA